MFRQCVRLNKHPFIIVKDIHPEQMEALLNYMYKGEVNVQQEVLPELIKAAEAFKIKGLAVPDDDEFSQSSKTSRKRSSHRSSSPSSSSSKKSRKQEEIPSNITDYSSPTSRKNINYEISNSSSRLLSPICNVPVSVK